MIAERSGHGAGVVLEGRRRGERPLLTRRAAIQRLAATPMLVGGTSGGEAHGAVVAEERLPTAWLCDEATGRFWHVADVYAWIERNADEPVLRLARGGLAKATDPWRRLRLVLRRCGLVYIEIVPQRASAAAHNTVRIQHWRRDRGDLRPFFTALGLARPETAVQFVNRKHETISWARGDEFLYGRPFTGGPALAALVERWGRHASALQSAPVSPDWTATTTHEWLPRWPQLAGGPGIPWAALEAAWRIVSPLDCPNCATPAILAGFGSKRVSFLGFDPRQEHVCPGCRRLHEVPLDGLDVRVAAVLRRG